jgi:transmembrane sensor
LLARVHHKAGIRPRQLAQKKYWPAAAAVLMVLFAGGYLFITGPGRKGAEPDQAHVQDVPPGTNRAVLTFADGRTMDLSPEQSGIIVGDEITYVDGSEVSGNGPQTADNRRLMSLTTPKGGQYRIVLADGTKVWLNASSVLRYPAAFSGDDRVVEIAGEGYFEVAEDKRKPFKVISNGLEIAVLGTAFNISGYPEEQEIRATLVSGAVKVSAGNPAAIGDQQQVMLSPGYEAVHTGSRLYTRKAHLATATGWKDGLFVFSGTELRQAMQQLSRWYNLEIEYKGDVPVTYFSGEIEKSNPLSAVLEILKVSGLNFKIESGMPVSKLIIIP